MLHINLNNNYNSATDTSAAFNAMKARFASSVGWHYTSPSGIKPDLHHGLLGRDLGGGLAGIGVMCSSASGFAVSTGLRGDFVSMGNAAVWDMMVVSSSLMMVVSKKMFFLCAFEQLLMILLFRLPTL